MKKMRGRYSRGRVYGDGRYGVVDLVHGEMRQIQAPIFIYFKCLFKLLSFFFLFSFYLIANVFHDTNASSIIFNHLAVILLEEFSP